MYQSILESIEGELWELIDEMNDQPHSVSIGHESKFLHYADRTVEVPLNQFETEKPKMPSPMQGLGQKLGLLKHSAETNAKKISDKVDALSTRMDVAVSKTTQALEAQEKDIVDVETFVTDLEKATNV